jgi:hypothetical protein
MSERTMPKPSTRSPVRTKRFRVGALVAIALIAGIIAWLALRDTGSSSSKSNATAVSVTQINALAASVHHPVFWVGAKQGYTYELTQTSTGTISLRYLPPGVNVGAKQPYLTVVTYPFPGAFEGIKAVVKNPDSTHVDVPGDGIAVGSKKYPESVHVAYPGVDYQVEVFDPTPGTASAIVSAGQLAAFGSLKSTTQAAAPVAATPSRLRALARSLGHPVYWAGNRKGYTYELAHSADGRVFIRYLPPGAEVGTKTPHLTVATYPYQNAYGALQALAQGKNMQTINLAGGGLAVLDTKHPKSIHLAYPSSDYQVEVFDPSPAAVRRVVTSGQVKSVG